MSKTFSFLDYITFVEDDSSSYEVGVTDAGFSYLDMASEKKRKKITFEEKQQRETGAALDGSKRARGQSNIAAFEAVEPDEVCFDTDLRAILRDIDQRKSRKALLPIVSGIVVVLFCLWIILPAIDTKTPVLSMILSGIVLFPAAAIGLWNTSLLDHSRRNVKFRYRIEGAGKDAFDRINSVLDEIHACKQLLLLKGRVHFEDTRYSAGMKSKAELIPVELNRANPPLMDLDFTVWHIKAFNVDYFFMPDHLLVYQGAHAGGVSYNNVNFEIGFEEMLAQGNIERTVESRVIGSTWRFVNKDGSPDKRFNNNVEIPKLELGRIVMGGSGIEMSLFVSRCDIPEVVPKSFAMMQDLGSRPAPKVAEERRRAAQQRRKEREEAIYQLLLDAMCCVMLADNHVAKSEAHRVLAVLKKLGAPWPEEELRERIKSGMNSVRKSGIELSVSDTCTRLRQLTSEKQRKSVLKCIDLVAEANGDVSTQEREMRNRFAASLNLQS